MSWSELYTGGHPNHLKPCFKVDSPRRCSQYPIISAITISINKALKQLLKVAV